MQGKPLSMRAYGKRLGVSHVAVSRAISAGRLIHSLAWSADGKVIGISDPDLADREWAENTDLSKAPPLVKEQGAARIAAVQQRDEATPTAESSPPPAPAVPQDEEGKKESTIANASFREKHWKANHAELEYRQAARELIPKAEIKSEMMAVFRTVRTKLLGVPNAAKQRMPNLSREDLATLEALIREALEALADEKE